jgi:type VI protein secretion system component VasK
MSDTPDKKEGKKAKKAKKADAPTDAVSVAAHPRARASIRRTRARTALAAFAIVLFLSLDGGVTGQEAAMRALVAGLAGNLIGWFCALAVWRQIVVQEVRMVENARRERARQRAEALAAEAEAKTAAAAAV